MNLAPIVLFVYNRPWHTRQTIETLQRCELASISDLYIFADGPKPDATDECKENINAVRNYIRNIDGFQSIHIEESPANKGLANSVISGVSKVIEKHDKVIVLEDDILTHPFFLQFMNDALYYYREDKRIFSIGAFMDDISIPDEYPHDVFICQRIETQGWGTWSDRWNTTEWDLSRYPIFKHRTKKQIRHLCRGGDDLWPLLQMQAADKIDSWAARWQYNLTLSNGYCLRPIKTFVNNIGMDGSGTHCGNVLNSTGHSPLTLGGGISLEINGFTLNTHIRPHNLRYTDGAKNHGRQINRVRNTASFQTTKRLGMETSQTFHKTLVTPCH